MLDEPLNGASEIVFMHPTYVLRASARRAAEAEFDNSLKSDQCTAFVSESDRGSHRDFANARRLRIRKRLFPFLRDVYRKSCADFAGSFIHRAVFGMPI